MKALIVEEGRTRGALAAARALRAAGWTVGVGAPVRYGLAARSRAVSAVHRVPQATGEGFAARVAELVGRHGYEVVFGAGDAEVLALAYRAEGVGAALPQPGYDVLLRATDKLELGRAAAAAGIATPEVVEPGALAGRGVVKPRWHWRPPATAARVEAVVVDGPDEARHAAAGMPDPVVQRYVEGPLLAYCCVVAGGEVVARSQQRATRIWPPGAGVSVRAETVPIDRELDRRAADLLRALEWNGLAELQFVEAGGVPHLLDLNGRIYGSLGLAVAAGANLPAIAAAAATARPYQQAVARPGVRYHWLEGDLRAGGRLDALRYARGAVGAIWRRDDPSPAIGAATHLARRALRKAAR